MSKKQRTTILFLLSFIVLWMALPLIIKSYIRKHYSYINPSEVSLHIFYIQLNDVAVITDNVQAKLDVVRIYIGKPIEVNGGAIDVQLGQKFNNDNNSHRDFIISDVKLKVSKNDIVTELNHAYVVKTNSNKKLTAENGTVKINKHRFDIEGLSLTNDWKTFKVNKFTTIYKLPFALPTLEPSDDDQITGKNVTADLELQTASIEEIQYLTFSAKGINLSKSGAKVKNVSVYNSLLAPYPLTFNDLQIIPLQKNMFSIQIKNVIVIIEPESYHVSGETECSDLANALPLPNPNALEKSLNAFSGSLSFNIQLKPKPVFELHNRCRFQCSASVVQDLMSGDIKYLAYHPNGEKFVRVANRSSADWVPFESLPTVVTSSFVALEDPLFFNHGGIISSALQNSFLANLKAGKFVRGGSTITMQLAKNVWLSRDKIIMRKVYEVLLTIALENCLTKEQILELYLNLVEFGPDIYGIGPASKYYFNKVPSDLSQEESIYLASLLPNPKKGVKNPDLSYTKKFISKLRSNGLLLTTGSEEE